MPRKLTIETRDALVTVRQNISRVQQVLQEIRFLAEHRRDDLRLRELNDLAAAAKQLHDLMAAALASFTKPAPAPSSVESDQSAPAASSIQVE